MLNSNVWIDGKNHQPRGWAHWDWATHQNQVVLLSGRWSPRVELQRCGCHHHVAARRLDRCTLTLVPSESPMVQDGPGWSNQKSSSVLAPLKYGNMEISWNIHVAPHRMWQTTLWVPRKEWSFFCLQERYFLVYNYSTRVGMGQKGRSMPKLDDLVPNMKTSCACFVQIEHAPNSFFVVYYIPDCDILLVLSKFFGAYPN